jgi:hypothetical protein
MQKFLPEPRYFLKTGAYVFLIGLLCSLFLFSNRPPDDYCGKYVSLGEHAGFPLNCDSYDYAATAENPEKLFEPNSIRQSRPVYVILAFTFGHLLSPATQLMPLKALSDQDELLGKPIYWGFMTLNFLFLLCAVLIFDEIADIVSGGTLPQFIKFTLSVFLASNIIIKTSFWSAHQQMLAIFVPLLCVYLALRVALSSKLDLRRVYLVAFCGGLSLITYGNFLVLFPMVLLALAVQLFRSRTSTIQRTLAAFVPVIILFVTPVITWSAILISKNGRVYNHEIEVYRQFVWVKDKLSVSFGDFWEQFLVFSSIYWVSIYRTVLAFIIGLFLLKLIRLAGWRRSGSGQLPANYSLARNLIAAVFALYFVFFWFMGYYSERITYTLVPVVLCLIALELSVFAVRGMKWTSRILYVLLITLSLIWVYNGVTTFEPYKELTGLHADVTVEAIS